MAIGRSGWDDKEVIQPPGGREISLKRDCTVIVRQSMVMVNYMAAV